MNNEIPMTKSQKDIMREFYEKRPTRVVFNKKERNALWRMATKRDGKIDFENLKQKCPALEHQVKRSYETGKNIQSAVFSECVYAQTIANMFELNVFVNCYENTDYIPKKVVNFLDSYRLVPRYVYANENKSRMLIQAGGCDGVDSALVTVVDDLIFYTIEFKEQGAKTGEPDLPKYGEDGLLITNEKWLLKNPQFKEMLEEQKGLNFFEVKGHNINNFSSKSIALAVSNVGVNKIITVICTEDKNGLLVMLPSNQAFMWAETEGEIRPAGRNHYNVWTPCALRNFLKELKAEFDGDMVTIDKSLLKERKERGGDGKPSGYKLTPLFFIYSKDCINCGNLITFNISKVRQLNPTIAGKMFFSTLDYYEVREYYMKLLK